MRTRRSLTIAKRLSAMAIIIAESMALRQMMLMLKCDDNRVVTTRAARSRCRSYR